jgi:hypothetical protein
MDFGHNMIQKKPTFDYSVLNESVYQEKPEGTSFFSRIGTQVQDMISYHDDRDKPPEQSDNFYDQFMFKPDEPRDNRETIMIGGAVEMPGLVGP